jgi:hypothetical protein
VNLPTGPEGLTVEWLTAALRAGGALTEARVAAQTTTRLGPEKGMTGQIARVQLTYDRAAAAAPPALIAKFAHPDAQVRAMHNAMGFYEREVNFYAHLAAGSRLRTPRCYFGARDPATGGAVLLLEDLAPARNGNYAAGCSVADAEAALLGLAPFHAGWWGHPLLAEHAWLALRGPVAVEQMPGGVQYTWPRFLDRLGLPITPPLHALGAWLGRHIGAVARYMYQQPPQTLVHNDYQGDNLFFPPGAGLPAPAVVDWQLTTGGRAVLDVATFLGGNLAPDDRRAHEERLLQQYHARLQAHGVADYSFAQCFADYRRALLLPLARVVLAVGASAQPGDPRGGPWDAIFARYWRAVEDLDSRALVEGPAQG